MCNIKGVACSDKATENNVLSSTKRLSANCFNCIAHNFSVLVHSYYSHKQFSHMNLGQCPTNQL